MLHSTELLANAVLNRSDKKINVELPNQSIESSIYMNGERSANTTGRLDEEHPELYPRVDKRTKLVDLNAKQTFSYPFFVSGRFQQFIVYLPEALIFIGKKVAFTVIKRRPQI